MSLKFYILKVKTRTVDGNEWRPIANLVLYAIGVVAVVAMWRGLWGLMDLYLWPDNPKRSNWASFIIGLVIIVMVLALVNP